MKAINEMNVMELKDLALKLGISKKTIYKAVCQTLVSLIIPMLNKEEQQ